MLTRLATVLVLVTCALAAAHTNQEAMPEEHSAQTTLSVAEDYLVMWTWSNGGYVLGFDPATFSDFDFDWTIEGGWAVGPNLIGASPAEACGALATSICGKGHVCCVNVGSDYCIFQCRSSEGSCDQPCTAPDDDDDDPEVE